MQALSLLIGTPVLSLLGGACAALALGARGGGMLLALLALPLFVPVLIFGAGAAEAQATGLSRHAAPVAPRRPPSSRPWWGCPGRSARPSGSPWTDAMPAMAFCDPATAPAPSGRQFRLGKPAITP